MTSHNLLHDPMRCIAFLAALKLTSLKRRWLDGYKWPDNGLPVMESIPNKGFCHREGRLRSPQRIDICAGSLLRIKRTTT
ncbi:hypothetical protein TNCV_356681 [Trichonephila clavipes]|nr:hypothetical protein TNCV_356681 [Trichonephila clavipes]